VRLSVEPVAKALLLTHENVDKAIAANDFRAANNDDNGANAEITSL
jgi:hypothetical protein